MTFVIVGGGPTGVELAGALSEIARHTLRGEFRSLDPGDARIILLEGADRVLPPFVPELSEHALRSLVRLGVDVRTKAFVRAIDAQGVTVANGETEERIHARTVLWAAGVRSNPLARTLAERTGTETDHAGRIVVGADLTIPGRPDIFVIGDMAHVEDEFGTPLPGLPPVAIQEGCYVAKTIEARTKGRTLGPLTVVMFALAFQDPAFAAYYQSGRGTVALLVIGGIMGVAYWSMQHLLDEVG